MHETWHQQRREINQRIEELTRRGVCYSCHNLRTGDVFPDQVVVWDDALFQVVLEPYPRMQGHTIIVWKPHRGDFSELPPDEAGHCLRASCAAAQALKGALGAEKVYLNTMCDGEINHLHFQLFPRYAGDGIGSSRFVLPRRPLEHGREIGDAVRRAFGAAWSPPA